MVSQAEKKKIVSKVNQCLTLMPGWKIEIKPLPESTNPECVVFYKDDKTFRRELGFILNNSPGDIKSAVEDFYNRNAFD